MAFSSACKASEHEFLESRGQPFSGHSSSQLWVPEGGPLYPMEIILVSFVRTAPTLAFTQCERLARSIARFMKISLKPGFILFILRKDTIHIFRLKLSLQPLTSLCFVFYFMT